MICVGYRKVNFKGGDGQLISGYSCYLYDEMPKGKADCFGAFTEKIFLSDEKFIKFDMERLAKTQKDFSVLYNRYGKIESIVS